MTVDIIMPKMGESIMEGTILKWIKKAGDKIERDEPILEISTDKVDTEVPAPENGILTELLFKEGDVIEVGHVIARMNTDVNAPVTTNAPAEEKKAEIIPPAPKAEVPKQSETPIFEEKTTETAESGFFSPLVLSIAKEEGIPMNELSGIKGTGLNSRVTKKDILEYVKNRIASPPAPAKTETHTAEQESGQSEPAVRKSAELPKHEVNYDEEGLSVVAFDNIRQKMAEHMSASVAISPHVNAIAEVDLTNVEKARKELSVEFEQKEGFKLTYMPFIAEAAVKALKDFPLVNSIIDDSSIPFKAITRSKINLGMAVAMENGGLIVPVIKNADSKNLIGLSRDMNDLGKRAKIKKLSLDEIQGGTFTISNYGVFGNIIGTMIINQPQVAIMGVGAIKKRPKVLETPEGDFIAIRMMVYLTLSFDHRLIDGALGGKFIMRVAHYLENFQM